MKHILYAAGIILFVTWATVLRAEDAAPASAPVTPVPKLAVNQQINPATVPPYVNAAIDPVLQEKINRRTQADQLESDAMELISQDKMDDGLELIRKAIAVDPQPYRTVNYGSILFGNGVEAFKKGDVQKGKDTLKEAETQLTKAIAGMKEDEDAALMSQAYFLLGEMYYHAFNDLAKAKEFYQKAVQLSDHPGAADALEKLK